MNAITILQKIWSILQDNKGYYLLTSLLALSLILLILSPENWFLWGLFGLLIVRVICLQKKAILQLAFVTAGITGSLTLYHVHSNVTQLDANVTAAVINVKPADIKVDGNQLSGTGTILFFGGSEQIAFFHTLKNEAQKNYWETLQEPIHLETSLSLSKPEGARNRHQFNYQQYLYRQSIHWTASIKEIHKIKPQQGRSADFERMRQNVLSHLRNQLPPGKMTDYLLAMLFNQTHDLDKEVMEAYRKIGVIHLFSISGMHIQFLIQMLSYLLLRLGVTKETARPLLLISIISYGLFLGKGVGIFRAVFSNSLRLLAQIRRWNLEAKDAFALTLLAALWLNPYLVFSLAFQLSYGLSGVLYMLSPILEMKEIPKWLQSVLLSFIMAAVSFPFLSYHFFEVTWLGMLVNIFFSFFFASCFFPLFWLVAGMAFLQFPIQTFDIPHHFFETSLQLLEWISSWLAEQKIFLIVTGRPALGWYVVLAGCVLAFLVALEQQRNRRKAFMFLMFSFSLFALLPALDPTGKIIHLDVGQGDATLFITPFQQEIVLIDTGGNVPFLLEESWQLRSDGEAHAKKLVSSLKAEGVRKLDAVILTHSDLDHIGNFGYLANEIAVNRLYLSAGMEQTDTWLGEMAEIRDPSFTIHTGVAPGRIQVGRLHFQILSPLKRGTGENEDSLVLATQVGGHRWLFTGDLDEAGERALINRYPGLQVDFLSVGHHGSQTSTSAAFLEHLQPKGAFISVGKNNIYGHPHPQVLERLQDNHVTVFRTDQQGAIHFRYNGKKQKIETMLQLPTKKNE